MELAACKKYVKVCSKYQLSILYYVSQVVIDENTSDTSSAYL